MAFRSPDLWVKSGGIALLFAKNSLKRYQHLIKWKKDASILELGFGTGHNSMQYLVPLLPKDYKEFIGSDVSEEMVDYAKNDFKIPKSKVVKLDACSDVPNEYRERFDHIFAFMLIHMLNKPREAFKNIHTMLKPGGSTFIMFMERKPVEYVMAQLKLHPKWSKYDHDVMIAPYFYSKSPQELYKKDIDSAGFVDYFMEAQNDSYICEEEEFIDLHMCVNVVIPTIPEELREEYIKEYFKEVHKSPVTTIRQENGKNIFITNAKVISLYATRQLH
ncbi:unnamed protein product [Phyllotreta striolata]|uniref:Methyltransferase domain-containing protein n=1 Tax=Phyllotreta striolata TaxID=444603 RepID=A0A9N9XML7_PHYSR|nr:unnamed protein product [Phyllotreta striolata]